MRAYPIPTPKPESPTPKVTPLDYLTRLVVPLASLGVAAARQELAWAFLSFAGLSLVIGFYGPVAGKLTLRLRRRGDNKRAQVALLVFRRFVERFGEFVDRDRTDSLHRVVQDAFRKHHGAFERLGLVPIDVLQSHWRYFHASLPKTFVRLEAFLEQLGGFADLLHNYERYGVSRVFDDLPTDAASLLDPHGRRTLEAARERYVSFREDYEEFEKNLAGSLVTVGFHPFHFSRPKPL